jgi:hypothetical protein
MRAGTGIDRVINQPKNIDILLWKRVELIHYIREGLTVAKFFSVVGMVIGLALIIMGIATTIPDDTIQTRIHDRERGGYIRYVGGDAYNFIIEASIRSGEIAGSATSRAIYLSSGAIVLSGSLIAFGAFLDKEKRPEKLKKATDSLKSTASGDGEKPQLDDYWGI